MTSAYAPTAYDSSRARTLPPVSAAERPTSALLETQGIHCGELLVMSSDDCIELLNSTKPEDLAELEEPAHESVFWGTHFSVHNVLLIVTYFFALLSACSVVAGILPLLALQFKKAILGGGGAFLVCYLIYRLGKYLLTTRWFEQVYKIRLSRKTGMVGRLIKGEWVDHPFDGRFHSKVHHPQDGLKSRT